MHGEVEHEAAESIVFGCCVDGWAGVNEDCLADVEA